MTTNRIRYGQLSGKGRTTGQRQWVSEIAWLSTDLPLAPPRAWSANHLGWVSSRMIVRVRIEAARNSQLACFSFLTKSAIFPPRKLPEAQAGEQDADDARPAVDARSQVLADQPAGDHLEGHEGQAGDEGQHGQVGQAGRGWSSPASASGARSGPGP